MARGRGGGEGGEVPGAAEGDQVLHRREELLAGGAAGAPVLQLDGCALCDRAEAPDETGVDVDLRNVIDDHANLQSLLVLQDMFEGARLSGSQEPGKQRDWSKFRTLVDIFGPVA